MRGSIIHREYSNPTPARLIITKDSIITENANKPRNIGYIDLNNYSPYPKNPKIANFFKEIGLAEEIGSGIKTITKYNKIYSGGIPSFKDDDIFKVVVPLEDDYKLLIDDIDKIIRDYDDFIKDNSSAGNDDIKNALISIIGAGVPKRKNDNN